MCSVNRGMSGEISREGKKNKNYRINFFITVFKESNFEYKSNVFAYRLS